MTAPFTLSTTLSTAWKSFKSHWKFLVPTTLATAAIIFILQMITNAFDRHVILMLLLTVVSIIAGIAITLGWTNISLRLVRSHRVSLQDFKTNEKSWGRYFVARLIYGLFTAAAIILVIIPVLSLSITAGSIATASIVAIIAGISGMILLVWLALRYLFISFVALDHPTMSSWNMLKASAKLGKGHMVDLFGFILIMCLINIVGALVFFVGLLITVPFSKIATAYVYEQLKKKHAA